MKNTFNFATEVSNFEMEGIKLEGLKFVVGGTLDMSEKETDSYMGLCKDLFDYSKKMMESFTGITSSATTIDFDIDSFMNKPENTESNDFCEVHEEELKKETEKKAGRPKKAEKKEPDIVITDDEEFIKEAKRKLRARNK